MGDCNKEPVPLEDERFDVCFGALTIRARSTGQITWDNGPVNINNCSAKVMAKIQDALLDIANDLMNDTKAKLGMT